MKNQYFGDVNDYLTYGPLRTLLAVTNLRMAVCWMLTAKDDRNDGRKTGYLKRPELWRHFDPDLFDCLYEAVVRRKRRHVNVVEKGNLLPGAMYHSAVLGDRPRQRAQYFTRMAQLARECPLVFFDPDNGMEVKSVPMGRRDSCKYLAWEELARFYAAGHSLVVFQHFPRVNHVEFISHLKATFEDRAGSGMVLPLETSNVVFFLLPQPEMEDKLAAAARRVAEHWSPNVTLWEKTKSS